MIKQLFHQIVEVSCLNALQVALHSLGENNLITPKTYNYLGIIYSYPEKYTVIFKMLFS